MLWILGRTFLWQDSNIYPILFWRFHCGIFWHCLTDLHRDLEYTGQFPTGARFFPAILRYMRAYCELSGAFPAWQAFNYCQSYARIFIVALLDWMFILYTKSNFLQARASLARPGWARSFSTRLGWARTCCARLGWFCCHCNTLCLYGDFPGTLQGTLLYGDFSSLRRLPGDSSLQRLFLFTETSRGLFSMETFPLYGDFLGTLLYGDFSSLRRLPGDSSLWRLFLFTETTFPLPGALLFYAPRVLLSL